MATPEPYPEYIIVTSGTSPHAYAMAIEIMMARNDDQIYVAATTTSVGRKILVSARRYGNTDRLSSALIAEALPSKKWFEEPKSVPFCPVNTFRDRYKSVNFNTLVRRFNPRNDRLINKRKTYISRVKKASRSYLL
jgi:hypothetical protein